LYVSEQGAVVTPSKAKRIVIEHEKENTGGHFRFIKLTR